VNKQHNILPSSPVDVFFGLATQGGDSLLTQDASFLGFEGIAFIDSKEYVPTLVSKQSNRSLTSKVYKPSLTSKKIITRSILKPMFLSKTTSKETSRRVRRVMCQQSKRSKTHQQYLRRVTLPD